MKCKNIDLKSKTSKQFIMIIVFMVFFALFMSFNLFDLDYKMIIRVLQIYYIVLVIYAYVTYEKISYILLFLLTLFLFNYGYLMIMVLEGNSLRGGAFNEYIFSSSTEKYVIITLIFNLLGINFGMLLYEIFGKARCWTKKSNEYIFSDEKIINFLSKLLIILTLIVISVNIKKIIDVKVLGYLAIYKGELKEGILEKIVLTIYPIFMYIYMGYLPLKSKKVYFIFFGYFLVNLTVSLQGGRTAILGAIIFLVWFLTRYYSLKISLLKNFFVFLVLIFLYDFITIKRIYPNINYINWISENGFSIFEKIKILLYEQGQSITLIGYYKDFSNKIEELKQVPYILQFLFEPVRIIYYRINNLQTVNDVGFMKISNNLQQQLTYIVAPENFLIGQGVGGSYIVELLDLGGYLAVFFGNAILIYFILNWENNFKGYSPLKRIVIIYIFSSLVFITRGNFINISFLKILQIIIVYFFIKIILKRKLKNSN